ncbi:MAG: LuxR family transcriptional regulator [Nocardioides sp.]|jgi:NarL family two-component system response regulator LiaR|uniref:response regulator transcription factor n=1 Tax=Nocardioides sp. TaxID=35761 RepID=UPI0026320B2E|nr:response regulator transcription factor [Nocardioides sp.]MCW2834564.1 LuxR family transcriptional regulator [Nocardioides sp.]
MSATRSGFDAPNASAAGLKPVRVTLVDDDELTSRGMASMLLGHRDRVELVSAATRDVNPIDIALYDHALSGPARPRRLEQLLADNRLRKVVIFTWNFQPWSATDLIEQGACGYLSKGLTSAQLVEALHSVNAGRVVISAGGGSGDPRGTRTDRGELLTGREADVLSHIASGYSNAEIAATLHLSVNSVKSYIRACYRKIDVESRSQAVLWGLNHGFGGPGASVPATDRVLASS